MMTALAEFTMEPEYDSVLLEFERAALEEFLHQINEADMRSGDLRVRFSLWEYEKGKGALRSFYTTVEEAE